MTYDQLPPPTVFQCLHIFKRSNCAGCYPPQYDFEDQTPIDLPPPSTRWKP
jgi:hypothetical protein